ncbi:MAG TPA: hypothetical protein VK166_03955 [Chitinophagaceae bacterium]|nr:hypothetical protein [Chitinophagaceae bacterium]
MEQRLNEGPDKVRNQSTSQVNDEIDLQTRDNILWYSREEPGVIAARMAHLDKEWDMERMLILHSSMLSLVGIMMGTAKSRLWYFLPAVLTCLLAQHAILGWNPLMIAFRKKGIRTRKEIDMEKYALMDALKSKQA